MVIWPLTPGQRAEEVKSAAQHLSGNDNCSTAGNKRPCWRKGNVKMLLVALQEAYMTCCFTIIWKKCRKSSRWLIPCIIYGFNKNCLYIYETNKWDRDNLWKNEIFFRDEANFDGSDRVTWPSMVHPWLCILPVVEDLNVKLLLTGICQHQYHFTFLWSKAIRVNPCGCWWRCLNIKPWSRMLGWLVGDQEHFH